MSEESDRPLPELAAAIVAGAVRLAAASAAWLRLVAEFDARGGWGAAGVKSCAHWLAWQCGLGPGAAREHVRVARALRRLPRIEAAFAEGRLSYSKVRAITRVAEPATEALLIEFATAATASQTERTVRQWRRANNPGEQTLAGRRQFSSWWDDDGMLVLRARLTPEQGAALITAIDSLAERAARRDRAQAKRAAARTARTRHRVDPEIADRCDEDAEVALARERTAARRCAALAALAGVAADVDRRAGDPPRREVVVHVDADVLADDAAAGRAYLEGGPALSAAQARRMLCESTAVVMLERGREVLAVGRRKRRTTKAQRRAAAPRRRLRPTRLPGEPHRAAARPSSAALAVRRPHRPVQPGAALRCRPWPGPRPRPDHGPPRRPVDRHRARRPAGLGHRRRRLHRRPHRIGRSRRPRAAGDDRRRPVHRHHPLDQTIGRRPAAARDTTRAAGDREAASRDADGRDAAAETSPVRSPLLARTSGARPHRPALPPGRREPPAPTVPRARATAATRAGSRAPAPPTPPRSAPPSSPPANPTCPPPSASTANAWTCATSSASCSATATSSAAPPPRPAST
jgi:Domain of unknown function (DUF222)